MAVKAFWWSPMRSPRDLAREAVYNRGAWIELARRSRRGPSNFGDAVGGLILREILGQPVKWSPPATADLFSVGSILNVYEEVGSTAAIFGSGIRNPAPVNRKSFGTSKVLAVRGELTRDCLGLSADAVLGDPGLMIGTLGFSRSVPRSRALLIPHFATFGSKAAQRSIESARSAGYRIALPNWDPLTMASVISCSDYVATSSLHGLVFAHALGVPGRLVSFASDVRAEPEFKYRDYLSVFGVEHASRELATIASPEAVANDIRALEETTARIAAMVPGIASRLADSVKSF